MGQRKIKTGAMSSDTSGKQFRRKSGAKQEHNGKDEEASGLGDITISAGYAALEEGSFPRIRLEAFMKLPTADSDEGLGSGSFDWGPGISFSKWLWQLASCCPGTIYCLWII